MIIMDSEITVEGIVENIIFHNNENGYTVFSINVEYNKEEKDDDLICVGYIPNINEGEDIKVTGNFVMHHSYGKQFQIESYEKFIPTSEIGIKKYLASGAIKGIGPKIAEKIIKKFGKKTIYIMENEPERLSEIKGISTEKAMDIGFIFHEQTELRKAMLFLQEYGITPVYASKIYERYKGNTIQMVKTNPYSLADEIFGIGFKISDMIAQKVGISQDSPYRIKAGIKYILNQAALNGNVYLPIEELKERTVKLLNIPNKLIENLILQLHIEHQIWQEKTKDGIIIYLNSYYYAESYTAKKLLELSSIEIENEFDYDSEIKYVQLQKGIVLADEQKNAVKEAMSSGVLVITGGPGTGKTTTINTIINLLQNEGYEIELAAPTGRAAKRMTETTGINAQTIHRFLGITYMADDNKKQKFEKDEDNPVEADVIIVDECSMIDILLMNNLLKAVALGTRLILVGDSDQLPSVGPGNVLKDIINSNCIKVVRLTEIFRQAQESAIIMNAHRINNGKYPVLNEKKSDFFFIRRYDTQELIETVTQLAYERLPKYINSNNIKDIQILTPMRKSPLGVINLNTILQNKLNPKKSEKNEKEYRGITFREGDKVMQIKNNYNILWKTFDNEKCIDEGVGVFNGDEGIITEISEKGEYIEVLFDENKYVKYSFGQLDELELSYAITIHKSQGSEYKAVIIPVHSGPDMLFNRNLLYTAVTRAKELAVIVGIPEMLYKMVDNNKEINRYTMLKEKIISLYSFMINREEL